MDITNLFSLLTGMVLFLYGMSVMGDALQRAAGSQLETLLARLTSSRIKCILLGAGVTALIQSSSATTVMVVGFVNSGVMKLTQAIGIILGAILGTSITGWIIALSELGGGSGWVALFSTETITGVFALIGILLHSRSEKHSTIGDILLGFTVLMVGIGRMSSSVAPLADSPEFINVLTRFSNPLLGMLAGMAITAVLQSASAAVGVLQALSLTGAVDFATAYPLLLGISIGASFPVLLSALGAKTDGKRTAIVYLLISAIGSVSCAVIFYALNAALQFSFMHMTLGAVGIALVNTLFRLVNVILLWPFIGAIEKLACALIRETPEEETPDTLSMLPLDERFLPYPALAVSQSERAVIDMAKTTCTSISLAFEQLNNYSDDRMAQIRRYEDLTDQYEAAIGKYLMEVSQNEIDADLNAKVYRFLHVISDLELLADYSIQVSRISEENARNKGVYSENTLADLTAIQKSIQDMVNMMTAGLEDKKQFSRIQYGSAAVVTQRLCSRLEITQVARIQKGECTMDVGKRVNELIASYGRISSGTTKIVLLNSDFSSSAIQAHAGDLELDAGLADSPALNTLRQYAKKRGLDPKSLDSESEE